MTRLFITVLAALLPLLAGAQYPAKPVKIMVPAQPGGGLDLIGGTGADQLSRALDQSSSVETSGGAGGTIASMTTARAAPDGYTLMVGYVGTHGTNPAVRKLPYDAIKDFTPVAMVGGTPNLLVIQPSLPASDLKSFIDYARQNPAKVNYGTGGIGLLTHLSLERFSPAACLDPPTAPPYPANGPAHTPTPARLIHQHLPAQPHTPIQTT